MNDQISISFAKDASQLLADNKIGEALQLCEQGVKQFPLYAEGHFTLAHCYEINNQPDEAAREYERVLSFMPGHIGALNALAQLHYRKEMFQVGNQLKLSAYMYYSNDDKLARYLANEGLLPLSPESDSTEKLEASENVGEVASGVVADELDSILTADVAAEEKAPGSEPDEPVVYEPPQELAVEPEGTESLFVAPEFDRIIHGDEDDQMKDAEMLQMQDFAIPEPEEPSGEEPEPPVIDTEIPDVSDTDQPAIEESLFTEPDESKTEIAKEQKPDEARVDLSRYANTKDDFSTLMNDMFVPGQDGETEEEPAEEQKIDLPPAQNEDTQLAEERPILDTSVIFLEKKQEDTRGQEETAEEQEEGDLSGVIQDDNTLASDIANIPSPGLKEELPVTEPASTGKAEPDELSDVIDKIEEANRQRQAGGVKNQQEPQVLDSTAVFEMSSAMEDEEVSIEDIMSNPSLLTPTFGEILIAQKKFDNARHVFMELLKKEPENTRFKKKVDFLDKLVAMNK